VNADEFYVYLETEKAKEVAGREAEEAAWYAGEAAGRSGGAKADQEEAGADQEDDGAARWRVVHIGFGRTVALHYCSSASYSICYCDRYLFF
jgi:hypothetical protein